MNWSYVFCSASSATFALYTKLFSNTTFFASYTDYGTQSAFDLYYSKGLKVDSIEIVQFQPMISQ